MPAIMPRRSAGSPDRTQTRPSERSTGIRRTYHWRDGELRARGPQRRYGGTCVGGLQWPIPRAILWSAVTLHHPVEVDHARRSRVVWVDVPRDAGLGAAIGRTSPAACVPPEFDQGRHV